jgi:glycosyltransferase involved in cell wall biosynthesis
MIAEMLRMREPDVALLHVRMDFSANIADIGRMRPGKFLRLASLILETAWARLTRGMDILYYPPSGPKRVAVYRDIIVLAATRWLFRKTVFHFHAGGISELLPTLPRWIRPLSRLAFGRPDLSIRLSELNPEDGKAMGALRDVVVPYGIADLNPEARMPVPPAAGEPIGILFVGIVCESKGVSVLLEACGLLVAQLAAQQAAQQAPPQATGGTKDFRLEIMGLFESPEFERATRERIDRLGLKDRVVFLGALSGEEKKAAFRRAHVFCLPTFYENETFGVVLIEAMCFGLPVVTTRWRGVPSVVEEGEQGLLGPIKDAGAMAERLTALMDDPALRERMGSAGRERFVKEFGLPAFHRRLAELFRAL